MASNNKKKIPVVKNNLYILKLIWQVSKKLVIFTFITTFMDFALWAASNVLFMKYIFSGMYVNGMTQSIIFIVVFELICAFSEYFNGWFSQRYRKMIEPRLHQRLNQMMFDKASNVDIACFETTDFYDNYTKATTEVYNRALSVLQSTSEVIGALFASVWVIGNMFEINVAAGIFSFLPMIGSFLFGKVINKVEYKKNLENVLHTRRQDYANRVMYLQKFSKEMRLSNIYGVTKRTYEDGFNGINKTTDKYRVKLFWLYDTKNALCFPVVFEGMWLFAAYLAMVSKTIVIAEFAVLARSIVSTTWMLTSFTDAINTSLKNGLYIENLQEFLNYEAAIPEDFDGESVPDQVESIELRNVSFQYLGAENNTINNVSFIVNAGEKIALVGHNGAGKSTLIKLIMRFYDPTEGEILLNGSNIKKYNLKAYRNLIGSTFQDFQMLSMTVAENVLMESVTTDEQRNRAMEALKLSGAYDKIMELPKQVDTILTREFDDEGAVLSGGQFQKLAVARAFAGDSPIVLLDEPSSALDPVAEYQMYETIMQLSDGVVSSTRQARLSVIISHRLSSASMADRIYLLENGAVIESGTHKKLMAFDGTYADMYRKQAESYLQTADEPETGGEVYA